MVYDSTYGDQPKKLFLLSRSLKVIVTITNRSVTYDFLLVIHSNQGLSRAVSEKNSDFCRK